MIIWMCRHYDRIYMKFQTQRLPHKKLKDKKNKEKHQVTCLFCVYSSSRFSHEMTIIS